MVGFDQRNYHHCYDVWEHTLHAMAAVGNDPVLRCAVLLHDIGKPAVFTLDEGGVGHFYGHDTLGAEVAAKITARLRFDKKSAERITLLISRHMRQIEPTEKAVGRVLRQIGEEALRQLLEGKLTAFTGNSGVGKSSILNRLCPQLALATGEVSEKLGRGRHTTRHVELYNLGEDTYVADTPGFSSFDTDMMEIILKENLQYAFGDFEPYIGKCQFHDCTHRKEPGCAVTAALAAGEIEPTRYDSYLRLYEKSSQIKQWELK